MRNAYLQMCDYTSRFRILKGGKISLVVSSLLAGVTLSYAAPSGGVVSSGGASIAQNGSVTTITQSTNKASINWNSFSIGSSETVNFKQPDVSSITLNRVIGNERSVIDGALNANGQVWILNSNGVLFNKNASINTSGLVATTKSLNDTDFQNGNYTFSGESSASVINLGTITIADAGYAALLANTVQNEGTIQAIKGTVNLTGANEATINLNGNSMVSLHVNKGVLDTLVENKGAIYADGGHIYLTTNAVDELLKGVVNNTGILEANSLEDITGEIILYAHGGTTNVSGTLGAKEGFIETSGESLHVKSDVSIKAKKWLLDPTDITITDGGGSDIAGATMDADTITAVLNGGTDVTLQADNDITVNEAITWTAITQLELTADNNIYVNASIQNTNTTAGGVYFSAANTSDTVIFGANGKVIIYNPYQLQWVTTALNGKYELGGNINALGTSSWNSGAGFVPIGDNTTNFGGSLDGKGYVIDGLSINRPSTDYVGLFGKTSMGGTVSNLGLSNATIIGHSYVGGVVGFNDGTITNAYVTGSVQGHSYVGGVVGYNDGAITNAYVTGSVQGSGYVGGVVGFNDGTITNAYTTGSVQGSGNVGGLVGLNFGDITNAYATGSVSGSSLVGGLVGGYYGGVTTNSYWDIDTTGQSNAMGVGSDTGTTGLTTAQFANAANFSGWDTSIWSFGGGDAVAGYAVALRPYLVSVTAEADKPTHTLLFNSGWGTDVSPYTLTNWTQLQNINNNNILTHNYYFDLANDIGSATAGYTDLASATANTNTGWKPIGNASKHFVGHFDGQGHTIDGLHVNTTQSMIGLFGVAGSGSTIQNIGLTNVDIVSTTTYVGGLVGYNLGSISNAYVAGTLVQGNNHVGGLVGYNYTAGTISNAYATVSVNGTNNIGGLVGTSASPSATIFNAYASGSVTGSTNVGGLIGLRQYGSISHSFWNTDTIGSGVGSGSSSGLTGKTTTELQRFSTFDNAGWDVGEGASATPSLSMGGAHIWMMAPETVNYTLSDISNTYKGAAYTLSDVWSATTLFGANFSAWVLGTDYTFLDTSNAVVTNYTNAGTYSNLHVNILRNGYAQAGVGNTTGTLTITKAPLAITANNDTKTYNGTAYSGGNGVNYSGFVNNETASVLGGSLSYGGDSQGAIDAGSYTITPSGLSSGNYVLSYGNGALSIHAASTPPSNETTHPMLPNVAHIENGTATRSSFFNTPMDILRRQAGGIPVELGKMNFLNGGMKLPEGLDEHVMIAQY